MTDNKDERKVFTIGYKVPDTAEVSNEGKFNAQFNENAAIKMVELLNILWGKDTHWIIPLTNNNQSTERV